jgi:nucleoid-associated protein YgaU
MAPLLPATVASAPSSQPATREAVAVSGPLRPMEPVAGDQSIGATPPAQVTRMVSLPRAPVLTPMEPVSGNSAAPVTMAKAAPPGGASVSSIMLSPLTSSGSTGGASGQGTTYTVAGGDTLWKIATKTYGNGAQAELIKKANPGVNADRLQVGQKLILPAAATAASPATPGPTGSNVAVVARPDTTSAGAARPTSPGQTQYTIKPGDNPSAIAAREYGDGRLSAAIMKANPGLVANNLKVGQTIILPSRAQAQSLAGVSASSLATDSSPALSRATVQPAAASTTANRSTPALKASPAVARTAATVGHVEGKPDFSGKE